MRVMIIIACGKENGEIEERRVGKRKGKRKKKVRE